MCQESCGDAVLTVYRENGADGDIEVQLINKLISRVNVTFNYLSLTQLLYNFHTIFQNFQGQL